MTTLVVSRIAWAERLIARLAGAQLTGRDLIASADEASLARFPPEFWNESQEANVFVLERLKDAAWQRALDRGERRGAGRAALEARISQNFVLTWGRRLAMLRLCLGAIEARPLRVVSDLPPALVRAFESETGPRVTLRSWWCPLLRFVAGVDDLAKLAGRHLLRAVRLVRLTSLPARPADAPPYIAWLNALPAEVEHDNGEKSSVVGFLAEARGERDCDVVIQGASPRALPHGFFHRATQPPLRYRPSPGSVARHVVAQIAQLLADMAAAADFRHRTLVAPATFDLPAFRLWFEADRPEAVLYPNHIIGNEPPVALLAGAPPSMMVFYSANVSYRPAPRVRRAAGRPTPLEPEIRFIIADRLTMWSPEMIEAFRTAGFDDSRLVETGPVVFARAAGFAPTSRFGDAGHDPPSAVGRPPSAVRGPVRIGVFEVTPVNTHMRFEQGYGQLLYTPLYLERFFTDVGTAARRAYGEHFVLVRKIKRAIAAHHVDDPAIARLGLPLVARDWDDSLWRVLEAVDVVLCMPFTSVAYLADIYGIPAAYYDPGGTAEPTPLGGRAALLRDVDALAAWLKNPVPSAVGGPRSADRTAHGGQRAAGDAGRELFAAAVGGRSHGNRYDSVTRLERNVIHT